MDKFRKALKALGWIARKPVLLNRVLTDEDSWQVYVEKNHALPNGLPVITMDRLVKKSSNSLGPMTFLDGGSLPTDMMLLAGLAEGIKECRFFEIGTWRGESISIVATRAKSCHTLCLTDQQMRDRGMHERTIEAHRMFCGNLKNVTQIRGDSRSFDYGSLGMTFDLLFIDGDHHYDFILSDTRNVFKYLVHENSIVVWHDYGFHPDKVRFEVMAAILDGVGPNRTSKVYHVAHTKCAIYTGNSYPSQPADFPMIPEEYYTLELTRNKL
jgi:hypothetical protein